MIVNIKDGLEIKCISGEARIGEIIVKANTNKTDKKCFCKFLKWFLLNNILINKIKNIGAPYKRGNIPYFLLR